MERTAFERTVALEAQAAMRRTASAVFPAPTLEAIARQLAVPAPKRPPTLCFPQSQQLSRLAAFWARQHAASERLQRATARASEQTAPPCALQATEQATDRSERSEQGSECSE